MISFRAFLLKVVGELLSLYCVTTAVCAWHTFRIAVFFMVVKKLKLAYPFASVRPIATFYDEFLYFSVRSDVFYCVSFSKKVLATGANIDCVFSTQDLQKIFPQLLEMCWYASCTGSLQNRHSNLSGGLLTN